MINSFKELEVWQMSVELTEGIYKLTHQLPKEELYGLTSQARRAAVSIPSNIAEGQQRLHKKEFQQFLYQAIGSLGELETQVTLMQRIYKIEIPPSVRERIELLSRKLRKLVHALQS